ncbi:class I SAM-dependent methyltransferase [Nanoarchaeota archaeon]
MAKVKDYFDKWSNSYCTVSKRDEYYIFLRWIFSVILKKLPKKKNAGILDLGTGGGRVIIAIHEKFKDAEYFGLDISTGLLSKAKKALKKRKINASLIESRMSKIKLEDNSIDYVVSNFAIHHCASKENMIKEVFRVLKSNGIFIFGDMYEKQDKKHLKEVEKLRKKHPGLAKKFDQDIYNAWEGTKAQWKLNHPREYHITPKQFSELLKKHGFKKIEIIRSVHKQIVVIKAEKL